MSEVFPYNRFLLPRGRLFWVTVRGPGREAYNRDKPNLYEASSVILAEFADPFIEKIQQFLAENHQKGYRTKSLGFRPCDAQGNYRDINEADKTHYIFRCTTAVYDANGKKRVIPIYNSKGVAVDLEDRLIGNGSEGCLSGFVNYYPRNSDGRGPKEEGVSLHLQALQLLKFVEYRQEQHFEVYKEGFTGFAPQGVDTGQSSADDADIPF